MSDSVQLYQRLADELGDRLTPEWRGPLLATPRELFVPDQALRVADGDGPRSEIDRGTDPDGWLEAVYSGDILVTQRTPDGGFTSSCSMPHMVAGMLGHLDAQPGDKALEIGAGTGWNAAILGARVGEENVYTMEVDREVADFARANLARAGRGGITVITGDGTEGYYPAAPFDRVIATCTVNLVPWAWVRQTRAGGTILTPWSTALGHGALLKLAVVESGVAQGQFVDPASFMWLRDQLPSAPDEPDDFEDRADVSEAKVSLQELFDADAKFTVGLLVNGVKEAHGFNADGYIETLWILSQDSWASADDDGTVRQLGPRKLWDEVESAYGWWTDQGKPDFRRFGVLVTEYDQHVYLDRPGNFVN